MYTFLDCSYAMIAIQRVIILTAGLFGGLMLASPSHSMSRSPIIDLEYSRYRGIALSNGVDQYLGIRYAKAPLGGLRFRGPEDPEDTVGVSDAPSVRLLSTLAAMHHTELTWIVRTPLRGGWRVSQ